MTARPNRPGRRQPPRRRRPPAPAAWAARAVLEAEPLEDRSQASVTPISLLPIPDLAAALVAPVVAAPDAAASVVSSAGGLPELSHRFTSLDRAAPDADQIAGAAAPQTAPVFAPTRRELVLVDFDVPDRDELVRDLIATPGGSTEVVELQGGGVAEVTAILRGRRGLDSVSLISHASPGGLRLGQDWLTADTLGARAEDLRAWGSALAPGGDLLLYGCSLAANADGRQLVSTVAALTGADVAASTDLTGSAALGGNWSLEYATGPVAAPAFAAAGWTHTLNSSVITVDTTSDVADGDTSSISSLQSNPGADGRVSPRETFTYTPAANYNGPDSFTYRADDGDGGTATVTVTVAAVNDAPAVNPDALATAEDAPVGGNVLGNDADRDDDVIRVVLVADPSRGRLTLNRDGSFTYTPDAGFRGTDTFTYRATDGTPFSGAVTVTITVTAPDPAPAPTRQTDPPTPMGSGDPPVPTTRPAKPPTNTPASLPTAFGPGAVSTASVAIVSTAGTPTAPGTTTFVAVAHVPDATPGGATVRPAPDSGRVYGGGLDPGAPVGPIPPGVVPVSLVVPV